MLPLTLGGARGGSRIRMEVKLKRQENVSGDKAVATQGFGRVATEHPPTIDPIDALAEAYSYFESNGFVVLDACLSDRELSHLNEFCGRTQVERPERWGLGERRKPHHRGQGLIFSQPLLDYPELDRYTQHPRSYPLVSRILGGEDHVRFSEFNLRETPKNAGIGAMNFHHDAVTPDRLMRKPYLPCDWLCAIHYLSSVEPGTPPFCVVPKSNKFETLREAFEELGSEYREMPIYGKAGTCVLYDTATYHTRLDGDGKQSRRTWH